MKSEAPIVASKIASKQNNFKITLNTSNFELNSGREGCENARIRDVTQLRGAAGSGMWVALGLIC